MFQYKVIFKDNEFYIYYLTTFNNWIHLFNVFTIENLLSYIKQNETWQFDDYTRLAIFKHNNPDISDEDCINLSQVISLHNK